MKTSVETSTHCPLCGAPLGDHPAECNRCDWVLGYRRRHQEGLFQYDPRDAASVVLSIIPGAGHIFKGHNAVGIAFMAGVPVVFVLAFAFTMFFGWLLLPAFWIGVAADAGLREDLRRAGLPRLARDPLR